MTGKNILQFHGEFSRIYPYLRIELFIGKQTRNDFTLKKGKIIIREQMTVSELKKSFLAQFGIKVKVYRKSGKSWLETSVTDHWTLEEQNLQGELLERMGTGK